MRVVVCGDSHIGATFGLGKSNGSGGNTRVDDYEKSLNYIVDYCILFYRGETINDRMSFLRNWLSIFCSFTLFRLQILYIIADICCHTQLYII